MCHIHIHRGRRCYHRPKSYLPKKKRKKKKKKPNAPMLIPKSFHRRIEAFSHRECNVGRRGKRGVREAIHIEGGIKKDMPVYARSRLVDVLSREKGLENGVRPLGGVPGAPAAPSVLRTLLLMLLRRKWWADLASVLG